MAQRGRKGGKEPLNIVTLPGQRAPAPEDLGESERRIWTDAVRNMRADWYSAAIAPLLRAWCVQAAVAERLAARLRETPIEAPEYKKLCAMHAQATKCLATLAVKLRLSPSSSSRRVNIRSESAPLFGTRPWEE